MTLRRASDLLPASAGLLCGMALVLNHYAGLPAYAYHPTEVWVWLAISAITCAAAFVFSHRLILGSVLRSGWLGLQQSSRFVRRQAATYLVFLLFGIGATGFRLPFVVFGASVLAVFLVCNALLLFAASPGERSSPGRLAILFFLSGIAALVYQVTWQRALFACFGINIESATLVITIFMFGLGVGSLAGGLVSRRANSRKLIQGFLVCELMVGVFGLVSLPLIRLVGSLTVSRSVPVTAVVIFGLLSIPTLLMGATLPLLVTYADRQLSNVGRSVGVLYFVNTLGSALACYLTADILFVVGGERAATITAAGLNFAVGGAVYRMLRQQGAQPITRASQAEGLTISEPESVL